MKYLIIVLLSFSSFHLYAQTDTTKLKLNQVEVIKTFEANLEDAQKIKIKYVLPEQKTVNPKYDYDITIVPLTLKYPDPQIKPLAMNPDAEFYVNKGYIKAGYGVLRNPEIYAGYHISRKDAYDAGLHLQYQSLSNTSKNPYQQYRDASVAIYGSYMLKENLKLTAGLNTDFKKRYFYHTDLKIDSLYSDVSSARNLNGYNIKAGLTNAEPTTININYNVDFSLRNLSITNDKARESGFSVSAKIEKAIRKSSLLTLTGNYDYSAFNGVKEIGLSSAFLKPEFKTQIKNLVVQAGAHLLYSSDGQSSVFPVIMLTYGIAGPKLQVFADVHQDYFINNFSNLTMRNPWLSTNPDSLRNSVFRNFSGGIKGRFSFLTYMVKAGYKKVNHQLFLLNNDQDVRYFDMVFDTTGITYVSGNVDMTVSENLSVGGWLTQNIFQLKNLPEAWHTPNLEANAYVKGKLLDNKLALGAELFFGNGVSFLNKNQIKSKSGVLFDLNVTATYSISEHFSVFASGINLLNNKFERWYGYPSVGINGMIGANIIF